MVRFKLSPALARAHRQNRGKAITEGEAVAFVEAKRRARALRRARPYLARDAGFIVTVNTAPGHFDRKQYQAVSVARPGEFLNVPEVARLVKKLIRE